MSLLRMFSKQDFDTVMLTEQHTFWSRCKLCNQSFLWFHPVQFWVLKRSFSPLPSPTTLPFFTSSPLLSHQAKIVCLSFLNNLFLPLPVIYQAYFCLTSTEDASSTTCILQRRRFYAQQSCPLHLRHMLHSPAGYHSICHENLLF